MSIILNITKYNKKTELLFQRGNELVFGENKYGIASLENLRLKIFSIISINEKIFLRPFLNGIKVDEKLLSIDELTLISENSLIKYNSYLCSVNCIPSYIEALAQTSFSPLEIYDFLSNYKNYPSIIINVGAVAYYYYIPPGKKFTLGSHNKNQIIIKTKLLNDSVLSVENIDSKKVKFEFFSNELIVANNGFSEIILNNSSVIRLYPSSFNLELRFPHY